MAPDPHTPFVRTYALDHGPRVRLRLARRSDAPAVRQLLHARRLPAGDLDVSRLLTFDPSHRTVLAAMAPVDGTERLVAIGAIDLRRDADVDVLVVDERLTAGLGELLHQALRARAASHAARVA